MAGQNPVNAFWVDVSIANNHIATGLEVLEKLQMTYGGQIPEAIWEASVRMSLDAQRLRRWGAELRAREAGEQPQRPVESVTTPIRVVGALPVDGLYHEPVAHSGDWQPVEADPRKHFFRGDLL